MAQGKVLGAGSRVKCMINAELDFNLFSVIFLWRFIQVALQVTGDELFLPPGSPQAVGLSHGSSSFSCLG